MKFFKANKTRTFRVGGYSVAAAAIVLAIAVAMNVFAAALPSSVTQIDTTSNNLYSFSEETEKIADGLKKEVTIYWIVQAGEEDDTVEIILGRYSSLSDKIKVVKKDPDVSPTFLKKYDIDSAENNTLVVVCGDKYRYLSSDDIYEYDTTNYYSTGSYDVNFNGESAITSAINYVTSENTLKLYTLTGHGESELSTTFSDAVKDQNFDVEDLSLLSSESVPDDAAAVLIYAPESDISADEEKALKTYLSGGGNIFLLTNPPKDDKLTNLESLMSDYGVTAVSGIVVEGNQNYYAMGVAYDLLPTLGEHDITTPLSDGGYKVLLPVAQGLKVSDDRPDNVSVAPLLTSSDSSYSKAAGYNMTTTSKEDGDTAGPFDLAVAVTDSSDSEKQSNIVWVSSGYLLDDSADQQSSGGNEDFFINALSWMCDKEDAISIHAKSMSYNYLTISSAASSWLSILVVGVIPACYLAVGIVIWSRRKRR